MRNLNINKVSIFMTPKERAKLIVKLQMEAFDKVNNGELPPEVQSQIKTIVSACPNEQVEKYNFYISLKEEVWTRLLPTIEILLLELNLYKKQISPLTYLLSISPILNKAIEYVENIPVIVTKTEYNEAIKRAKKSIKKEVLQIDGRHGLAKQEAFYKLKVKEKLDEEFELLDEYLWWMDRYGKTKEELISKATNRLKNGADNYKRFKDKIGEEPYLWKEYKEYVGKSDDELKDIVLKEKAHALEKPSKKEYETWQKAIDEQKERIKKAVIDGELVKATGKIRHYDRKAKKWSIKEVEGIEAGSYYDWDRRYQKYAGEPGEKDRGYNPLSEDCIELRYTDTKGIVYPGDINLTEKEERSRQAIVVSSPHDEYLIKRYRQQQSFIVTILTTLLPVKVNKDWFKSDMADVKISKKDYEDALIEFVTNATNKIKEIKERIALTETISDNHYDGELLSSNPKNPFGTIERAKSEIELFINTHNSDVESILQTFRAVEMGHWEFELENKEKYLLNKDIEVNQEWVQNELEDIEARAS